MKNYTSFGRLISNSTLFRKHFQLFIFLFLAIPLSSQTTIWSEDFESCGNTSNCGDTRYTSSSDFFGGASDYFGRIRSNEDFYLTNSTAGNNIHITNPYLSQNNDYYYAAEDVNDTGPIEGTQDGNAFKDVSFSGIDISSATGLTFRGLFAAGDNADPCGSSTYDDADFVEIYYDIGGGEVKALCFNPDLECNIPTDITNEPLYHDPNCDGDGGEGTILTNTFQEFTFAIPDATTLDLRIRVRMDAGNEEFAFDWFRVEGTVTAPDVCPTITSLTSSEDVVCVDDPFNLTAAGLADMAVGDNGDANFGIEFKAFTVTPADPYVGGTSLGTVPFGGLTMGNTEAILTGATIGTAGFYELYAVLSPTPTDATCRPSQMTFIDVNALPDVTFIALDDLCLGDGVQINQVGGLPMQGTETGDIGVYSGPGVTNNGTSYDFDPVAAGVGVHTLMYEYTDGLGCVNSATDNVEVFVAPDEPVVSDINVCEGESTLIEPTGGVPPGPGNAWMEDFEDHGNTENGGDNRYTSTNDFFSTLTDDDYFGRVEAATLEYYLTNASSGLTVHSNVVYSGHNGDFYYAAEDLDDLIGGVGSPDGLDIKDLTVSNIDISGSTGLTFKGLFAAGENDPCGSSIYDDDDFIEIYYDVDGGGEVLALCFNPDLECNIPTDVSNEPLYHDPNCDGDGGEGTLMTATFAEFSFAIPDGGLLDLRIRIHMDAGSEEVAFDYFRVEAVNNVGTMYKFYDDDPNNGGVLLAGPATSYDPMTTPGTSPQSIWVTTCGAACDSPPVEVVVTVSPNPTIGCPDANPPTISGCNAADITIESALPISTMSSTITEAQFLAEGGTISPPGATTNISYIDVTGGAPGNCPFTVTRTFTLETNCASDVVCVQNWVIDDTTNPTIMCPADPPAISGCTPDDVTMESALPFSTGLTLVTTAQLNAEGGSWDDNCTPQLMIQYQDVAVGTCDKVVTRTFTVTDVCGNTASCDQTFNIIYPDPIIMCPADVTVECGNPTDPGNTGSATATDACGGATPMIVFNDVSVGGCGNTEVITRTWTATDDCGNTSTCDQIITVEDTTPPTIDCPADATVECGMPTDPGATGNPTGSDVCSLPVTFDFTDVSVPGCGGTETITRTWTATDGCGLTATCVQLIFVVDNTPPIINCPPDVVVECGNPTDPAATGNPTGSDICSLPVTFGFVDASVPGCGLTETITRTWTATDACGQTATCDQIITIVDTSPPTAVCNDITVDLTGPVGMGSYVLTQADINAMGAGSSDLCGDVEITAPPTVFDCDDLGDVPVTITITDECGLTSQCIATVTVADPNILCCQLAVQCPSPVLPAITCNDPIPPAATNEAEFEALGGDIADLPGPCGTLIITHMDTYMPPTDICNGRTMTRVYTIMDDNTTVFCTQTLAISPPNPPMIVCPANVVIECDEDSSPANTGTATATGDCGQGATVDWVDAITPGACPQESTITRTWTATDDCGNTSSCDQIIEVVDTQAPAIVCPPDVVIECDEDSSPLNTGTASCVDACDTDVIATFVDAITPGSCPHEFTITRTWTCTDDCGNASSCDQIINVVDTTDPTFTVPPDVTIACADDPTDLGLTGDVEDEMDNCSGYMPSVWINEFHYDDSGTDQGEFIEVAGNAGINLGDYSIVRYNGFNGNTYSTTTNLAGVLADESNGFGFEDIQYPTNGLQNGSPDGFALVRNGTEVIQFLSYEGSFMANNGPAAGMTSTDVGVAEGGGTPAGFSLRLTGSGDEYSDFSWNAPAAATPGTVNQGQTMTTPPPPSPITVDFNDVNNIVDICVGGTIDRTWTVTDACGNDAEAVQVITVNPPLPPMVVCPPDMTVQCEEDIVTDPNDLIVTTDCGLGFIAYVKNPLVSGIPNCDGTVYTYIYVVRDDCGNEVTCEQQFLIQNDAPTVTVIPGTTVECWEDIEVSESDATVVTDCPSHDYVLTILPVQFNGPENCPGTEVIYTYRVKDQCNRIVETDRIFTIGQNDAPTILAPLDITCECLAGVNPNAEYAVVTTACGNGVDYTVDISDPVIVGPIDCPGTTYSYTYTVTDACGRTDSDIQTFTVNNGPPVFQNCPEDNWLVLNCEDYGGEDGVIQVIEAWIASVTAESSCGVPLTVLNNFNPNDIGTCINDGFTTVIFRAMDNCGRQSMCEGTIIVTDTEAPEIVVEAQDHYEICNYNTPDNFDDWIDEIGGAVAEDGCFDGDVFWTTSPGNPSINCMGQMGTTSVTVTFIATDNCGNKAETTATFHALMNGGDLTDPGQEDQMYESKGEIILNQNQPNPFKQETQIGFYLPVDMEAALNVYDVSGRLIKQVQGDYSKGYHVVSVTRDDFTARGILIYQLETRMGTITKRMILIQD